MHASNHNRHCLCLNLPDEAATLAVGAALARALRPGLRIGLEGDLGSGKTTLVRGLLRGLGHGGKVKSPTFTLVELYAISNLNVHHFDFYRFNQPEEYLDGGLDEYFHPAAICLVEWPDKAGAYLPAADLRIGFAMGNGGGGGGGGGGRRIELAALSPAGQACLSALRPHLPESIAGSS